MGVLEIIKLSYDLRACATYRVRVQEQHLHGWRCRYHLGDICLYGFDDVHDDSGDAVGYEALAIGHKIKPLQSRTKQSRL